MCVHLELGGNEIFPVIIISMLQGLQNFELPGEEREPEVSFQSTLVHRD